MIKFILNQSKGIKLLDKPDLTGNTPLHIAAHRNHIGAFVLLVENNADLEVRNRVNILLN
jgi:ankyrin repeat protein